MKIFKKKRDEIVDFQEKSYSNNPNPAPLNCGSPCTNPGFESGSVFWNYWGGNPDTNADPTNLTSGFNPPPSGFFGLNPNPHLITTSGGFDPNVGGTTLPVVPPSGGNNALRLGDLNSWGGNSWGAARASISFTVSANNANFTYRYAIVLEDPNDNSHDPINGFTQRPYFRVKLRDQAGNVVTCGDYEVVADAGQPAFTTIFTETAPGSNIWYRPWTTVFVPLQAYIGQCVTIEFTTSDCVPGGHFGYGYVDCSCEPLNIITSSPNFCGSNLVTLTAPAGGVSYIWTDSIGGTSGIVGSTTGQAATVNLAGTYKVAVTSVAGPTCTTNLNITIGSGSSSPVAQFTNTTVCHNVPMQFTDSSIPIGSIDAWEWDFDNDGITDDSVQNPLHTFSAPGIYPVTLTVGWGGCNDDTTMNINVNPPILPVLTPAGPFCANAAAVNLIADMPGGIWSGAGITDSILGTFDPSIAIVGSNIITYTVGDSCSAISSQVIIVNPVPVSNAGPDIDTCSGNTISIGTTSNGSYTYAWLPSTGLSSTSISNPDVTITNNGTTAIVSTYTVTTSNTSFCSSTDQVQVTIYPQPVLTITTPAPVCAPLTIDLTAPSITSGSTGGGVFSYYTDSGASNSLTTPTIVGNSSIYYIKVTGTGGCTDIEPVTATVNPLPVSDAGPDLPLCSGNSGTIGTPSTAGYTYSWTPTTGFTGSPTASNPTLSLINLGPYPTDTSSYIVTTIETLTGCQSSDTTDVIVYAVATVNAGSSLYVCSGSSITLGGSVGGTATGGTWSGGTGTYSPDNTTLNAVYTPSTAEYAADSAILTLTTNDPAGPCTFSSSNVIFHFYKNPIVEFSADDPSGCPIHCLNFTNLTTVDGGDSIISLNWDFGDGSPNSGTANPSHCFLESGFYDVTLTATSNHQCVSSLTHTHFVEIYDVPVAAFDYIPNPATILDPIITFENQSSADVNYWFWDFGDSTTVEPNVSNPVHDYLQETPATHLVTLIVQNANGCIDTVAHPIYIGPEFTFYIPNAFTPNGDGHNDYFFGSGIGIEKYDLWVFDRWGNMIFHGKELEDKWDGKANGGNDAALIDVFIWKVQLTDVFNKIHNYIGTVTLVR